MKRFTVFMLMGVLLAGFARAQGHHGIPAEIKVTTGRPTSFDRAAADKAYRDMSAKMQEAAARQTEQTGVFEGYDACVKKGQAPFKALRKQVKDDKHLGVFYGSELLEKLDEHEQTVKENCDKQGAQQALELLQMNRLDELKQMPNVERYIYGALRAYYKQLYGQNVEARNVGNDRLFVSKYKDTWLKGKVAGLIAGDGADATGRKIMGRMFAGEPTDKMVAWAMDHFDDLEAYYGNHFTWCQKADKVLNEAYGMSLALDSNDLFHRFKQGVFNEFLKRYDTGADKECFKKLMIGKVTQEQRDIVNQTIAKCSTDKAAKKECAAYKRNASLNGYWTDKERIRATVGKGLQQTRRDANGHMLPSF